MNKRLIKLGLDSYMLNYIHNEKPRRYFLSAHADEDDLQKFAELLIKECASQCLSDDCMRILNYFGVKG